MGGASRRRGAKFGVVVGGDELESHLVLVAEGRAGALDVLLLSQVLGAARGRAENLVGSVEERVVHLEGERRDTDMSRGPGNMVEHLTFRSLYCTFSH